MDRNDQLALMRRLVVEHFLKQATWPSLKTLQRRLVREFDVALDARVVARQLSPSSYLRFQSLEDLVMLDIEELAREPSSMPLLEAVARFIAYASHRYKAAPQGDDVFISQEKAEEDLDISPSLMGPLRSLLPQIPFVGAWLSGPEGMVFHVADDIVRYRDVQGVPDLLGIIATIREEEAGAMASLTRLKNELVIDPLPREIMESSRLSKFEKVIDWLSLHPLVKGIVLIGSVAGGIVAMIQLARAFVG